MAPRPSRRPFPFGRRSLCLHQGRLGVRVVRQGNHLFEDELVDTRAIATAVVVRRITRDVPTESQSHHIKSSWN